jgi:hypothetical protein
MAIIQKDVLTAFYKKLGKSKEFDQPMLDSLRKLLESDKKIKVEELVAILLKGKQEGGV